MYIFLKIIKQKVVVGLLLCFIGIPKLALASAYAGAGAMPLEVEETIKKLLSSQILFETEESGDVIKTRCQEPSVFQYHKGTGTHGGREEKVLSSIEVSEITSAAAAGAGASISELIEGSKDEKQVNAADGRRQVKDTCWPYSVHGLLAMKLKGAEYNGTGTLIGPNIVLTAGHCIYDHDEKAYTTDFRFHPSIGNKVSTFSGYKVVERYVPKKYVNGDKNEDYGLLFLDTPAGGQAGYFGLAVTKDTKHLKGEKINVTGYPGDKVKGKSDVYEMWGMKGTISEIDDYGQMHYKIDTYGGQSGSGVWYQEGGDYFVRGVHVRAGRDTNIATLITEERYEQIKKWVEDYAAECVGHKEWPLSSLTIAEELSRSEVGCLMSYRMPNLEAFNLCNIGFDKKGAEALAGTKKPGLTNLCLEDNKIGIQGTVILLDSEIVRNLVILNLYSNKIGDAGAETLAISEKLTNLRELILGDNNIGDKGVEAIAKSKTLRKIIRLLLDTNKIGNKGAKAIAKSDGLRTLIDLELCDNLIDDEGAAALADSSLGSIAYLNLESNNISIRGAVSLAISGTLKKLNKLYLRGNAIGEEGAKALKVIAEYDGKITIDV